MVVVADKLKWQTFCFDNADEIASWLNGKSSGVTLVAMTEVMSKNRDGDEQSYYTAVVSERFPCDCDFSCSDAVRIQVVDLMVCVVCKGVLE